jgi:hypothetical protein
MNTYHIKNALYHVQSNLFNIFILINYLSFIALAIGIKIISPDNLNTLEYYTKIYVSLFLLFRFNPFRKIKFNDLDRKIAFSAGIFLITTTIISDIVQKYAHIAITSIDL